MTAATTSRRAAFLQSGALEITAVSSLPDHTLCEVCGESITLTRVYASDQPVWTAHAPFEYAECCLDCAAVCVSVAVLQQSYGGSAVRVEVAADVWACRDDEGRC